MAQLRWLVVLSPCLPTQMSLFQRNVGTWTNHMLLPTTIPSVAQFVPELEQLRFNVEMHNMHVKLRCLGTPPAVPTYFYRQPEYAVGMHYQHPWFDRSRTERTQWVDDRFPVELLTRMDPSVPTVVFHHHGGRTQYIVASKQLRQVVVVSLTSMPTEAPIRDSPSLRSVHFLMPYCPDIRGSWMRGCDDVVEVDCCTGMSSLNWDCDRQTMRERYRNRIPPYTHIPSLQSEATDAVELGTNVLPGLRGDVR